MYITFDTKGCVDIPQSPPPPKKMYSTQNNILNTKAWFNRNVSNR